MKEDIQASVREVEGRLLGSSATFLVLVECLRLCCSACLCNLSQTRTVLAPTRREVKDRRLVVKKYNGYQQAVECLALSRFPDFGDDVAGRSSREELLPRQQRQGLLCSRKSTPKLTRADYSGNGRLKLHVYLCSFVLPREPVHITFHSPNVPPPVVVDSVFQRYR